MMVKVFCNKISKEQKKTHEDKECFFFFSNTHSVSTSTTIDDLFYFKMCLKNYHLPFHLMIQMDLMMVDDLVENIPKNKKYVLLFPSRK